MPREAKSKDREPKTNAMRFLETHGVSYTSRPYPCDEFIDGVTMAEAAGIPLPQTFKTLVARSRPHVLYVFAIPVAEELDMKKAARAVGEKSVELLPVKELLANTGYIRGCCSVVGMKKQFPTVIASSALQFETIFLSGGKKGMFIEVSPREIAGVIGAEFGDITV